MIPELPSEVRNKVNKQTNKHIKTLKKTEKEMKTKLPTTICLIDCFFVLLFFFWVYTRCYLIKYVIFYISFEGWTKTSLEVLASACAILRMVVCAIFFLIKCDQFELSTKFIKRKSFCYTLHWSSTTVVFWNLPLFTLTFSSVNKHCL